VSSNSNNVNGRVKYYIGSSLFTPRNIWEDTIVILLLRLDSFLFQILFLYLAWQNV
jgi:hypothetical protein